MSPVGYRGRLSPVSHAMQAHRMDSSDFDFRHSHQSGLHGLRNGRDIRSAGVSRRPPEMTMQNTLRAVTVAGIGLPGFLLVSSLFAQPPASVWDGVFTPQQVSRGRSVYSEHCFECHQRALTGGGETRPLAGDRFLANWDGENVGTLFDRVRTTMPFLKPGSLNRQQVADVVAFILYFNNFPAGNTELSTRSETLNEILITAVRR